MKKKKTIIAVIAAALVLIILFVPFSVSHYDDGGTKEYRALTYKVIKWQRYAEKPDGTDGTYSSGLYTGTRVHWFADSYKSDDELWEEDKDSLTLMDG